MTKFREKDLDEVLKEFQSNSIIEIEFENNLSGKITIKDATIKYDKKVGFININGINTSLKINTTLVYTYEKEKNRVKIDLDTLLINIKKLN